MDQNAQTIALAILAAAKDGGYLESSLANIPELADLERTLFVDMLKELHKYLAREKRQELTIEEISSMFAFVFAKAAEIVTNFVNNKTEKITLEGLFDGKIPFYADDVLIGFCKKSRWPMEAGSAFIELNETMVSEQPELELFEALKWSFRVSEHIVILHLEKRHRL